MYGIGIQLKNEKKIKCVFLSLHYQQTLEQFQSFKNDPHITEYMWLVKTKVGQPFCINNAIKEVRY